MFFYKKIVVTRVARSEMPSSKIKIKYLLWLLLGYSLVTRWLLVIIKYSQALVQKKTKAVEN